MAAIIIAIDNGTTGTITLMGSAGTLFESIPTKKSLLGKAGKLVTRVDHEKLRDIIEGSYDVSALRAESHAYVERPFTGRFLKQVLPGQRAFEAVIIVLEQLGIGFQVVDSREWQKPVLGKVSGSANLKKASLLRGEQMFPAHAQAIRTHGDADSLLMAYHFRRH